MSLAIFQVWEAKPLNIDLKDEWMPVTAIGLVESEYLRDTLCSVTLNRDLLPTLSMSAIVLPLGQRDTLPGYRPCS